MLEYINYRPYFTQKGVARLTCMERKLMNICLETANNRRISPFPYAIMGFLNGKFGSSGKVRIRLDAHLSNTVFADAVETRHWLITAGLEYQSQPDILEYYSVPEGFNPNSDNFNRIVPPTPFFKDHMDFSLFPYQVTFRYKRAILEVFHRVGHQKSYRGIVLV